MEYNFEELEDLLNKFKIKDGNSLNYNKHNYLIFLNDSSEDDFKEYGPTMFSASTKTIGYDIYLSQNYIPKEFLKIIIYHEIIESILVSELGNLKSHKIASQLDHIYAKKSLSEKSYTQYLKYVTNILERFGK
jgi:hypothetical protein